MTVAHVEILVEEQSMEEAIRILVPRLVNNVTYGVYSHQGKHDLLRRLPDRLRAYARFLPSDWRIVVVVDRDDDDCHKLKSRLDECAVRAGLTTRTAVGGASCQVVNRVAIEELEAWYFGDWQAVVRAYPRVPREVPRRSRYRDPDAICGGTWEALERILRRSGYFSGGLRKTEAAQSIVARMEPDSNSSHSFRAFRDAILEMAQ
jgi:hypothetical protein